MPVVHPTILGYGLSPDGRLVLTWSPVGLKLQRTTDLGTPDWQDVPNSENSATVILPMTDKAGFFRLIKP